MGTNEWKLVEQWTYTYSEQVVNDYNTYFCDMQVYNTGYYRQTRHQALGFVYKVFDQFRFDTANTQTKIIGSCTAATESKLKTAGQSVSPFTFMLLLCMSLKGSNECNDQCRTKRSTQLHILVTKMTKALDFWHGIGYGVTVTSYIWDVGTYLVSMVRGDP